MNSLSGRFHGVTYVVTDAARAAQRFGALVPGAIFSRFSARMEPVGSGRAGAIGMECTATPVGPHGEYEIRLVQPLTRDAFFHRSLETAGPGPHHVVFRVPDLDSAALRLERGAALVAELRGGDGRTHLYYRCDPIGGLIELSEAPPPAPGAEGRMLAAHFMQIAYVVDDISAAREWVEEVLGCEIAAARDIVQGPSWNLRFRGKPVPYDFGMKMVIGKLGPTGQCQIELLEPQRNENVLAEFLREHGPGINHIAFSVPDYLDLTRALRATGIPPLKEIHVPGMVHSSYFDCGAEELGTIEVFEVGPHA
jgi:catechol 2,3-dioxygenase-like lactoylglutathione lyase family enzyme